MINQSNMGQYGAFGPPSSQMQGPSGMGSGPTITGKFFHKTTGREIFVRDSVNDGNRMQLVLSDGSLMDMSEFQNYISMSDEEYDQNGNQVASVQQTKPAVDENLLFAGMGEKPISQAPQQYNPYESEVTAPQNSTDSMINKILDKSEAPEIVVTINWHNKPEKEFQMLKDFFDVTDEDIANAVFNKYGDMQTVNKAFIEALS